MNKIDTLNTGSLALRNVILQNKNLPSIVTPDLLAKSAPYFGYIDIEIDQYPIFGMFSANDCMVARNYFWNGKDSYEPMSLKVWGPWHKKVEVS